MYRFRLQRVHDHRRRRTESLERELYQMQQLLRQGEARLEALQAEGRVHQEQLDASYGTVLPGEELKRLHLSYCNLMQRIEAQTAATTQITTVLAARRQVLIQAQQEEKTVEVLNDKAKQRYNLEHSRREQRLLDERTITRFRYEH